MIGCSTKTGWRLLSTMEAQGRLRSDLLTVGLLLSFPFSETKDSGACDLIVEYRLMILIFRVV